MSRLLKIINFASPHSTIFPSYGELRIDYISDFLLRRSPLNGTCEGMWINLYLHHTATPIPVLAFVDYDTRGSPRDCGGQARMDTELSHESEGFIVIETDVTQIRILPSAVSDSLHSHVGALMHALSSRRRIGLLYHPSASAMRRR
jgi:hypothetical protein